MLFTMLPITNQLKPKLQLKTVLLLSMELPSDNGTNNTTELIYPKKEEPQLKMKKDLKKLPKNYKPEEKEELLTTNQNLLS